MTGGAAGRKRHCLIAIALLALSGCGPNEESVDFRTLRKPDTPNSFLACAPALCSETPDMASPVYAAPVDAVLAAVRRIADRQPRTTLLREDAAAGQLVYVQRSAVFRFPDTIWVQAAALPEGGTLLAVYSRSAYGYTDLGVNRQRVESWLAAVDRDLAPAPAGRPGGGGAAAAPADRSP